MPETMLAALAKLERRGVITTDPAAKATCCGIERDDDGFCIYRGHHQIYVGIVEPPVPPAEPVRRLDETLAWRNVGQGDMVFSARGQHTQIIRAGDSIGLINGTIDRETQAYIDTLVAAGQLERIQ